MKDDAVKGVKHKVQEHDRYDLVLEPFAHLTPPETPHDLSIRIFNMSATKRYHIIISEVVETTTLPKRKT